MVVTLLLSVFTKLNILVHEQVRPLKATGKYGRQLRFHALLLVRGYVASCMVAKCQKVSVATSPLDAWPGSIPASQATGLAVPDVRQHALYCPVLQMCSFCKCAARATANAQLVPLQMRSSCHCKCAARATANAQLVPLQMHSSCHQSYPLLSGCIDCTLKPPWVCVDV